MHYECLKYPKNLLNDQNVPKTSKMTTILPKTFKMTKKTKKQKNKKKKNKNPKPLK